jgi:glycosyltransferase involved in cell wall biosynthesis
MNVLYYKEPRLSSHSKGGGVFMVNYNLSKALLANQVMLTYYPAFHPKSFAGGLLKVYSGLLKSQIDITHFITVPTWKDGSYPLFRFSKLSGAATLLNIHGIFQVEYLLDYPHTKKYKSFMNKIVSSTLQSCTLADKLVTYSEFMKRQIIYWYGINPEKIAVIPNGVDLSRFSERTRKFNLSGNPAVLYFGLLSNFKGVDLLIEAASKLKAVLPNLKVHLVGHGNEALFRQLAKQKEIEKNIVFHGYCEPELAPSYYKSADVCVFPSRRDSFGITLLEAMASGIPIIASRRGGTPEIIRDHQNGVLFDPSEDESLSNAILELSQDHLLSEKISENALKTVENYSWQNIAEKYCSLYNILVMKNDKYNSSANRTNNQ